ncbi:MAG TPA: molybdopterin-binding protein [Anaerolineales bacterium]|nr:molybdopterin-binding protein [Anaerolineales bacterium]
MKFGPLLVTQAEGKILGHNISNPEGKRVLPKGRQLTIDDVRMLTSFGRDMVYVAELEAGDIGEDIAAERIARSVSGAGIQLTRPKVGRVNLLAEKWGVLRVDASQLARINACEGISLATLPTHAVVQARKITATVKVLPFALPETSVIQAETIAAEYSPVVQLFPLRPRTAALVVSSSPYSKTRVLRDFTPALQERLERLGSRIHSVDFVPLEEEADEIVLTKTIRNRVNEGAEIIILAGETAIMDRYDIAPRAVERAGGEVACYGAPVDPGNLLMLAYLGEVPILGAPGCARSRKTNVIDWVLPPLLAGDRLTRKDILQMGHGGLLDDIPKRPMPRE